MDELKNDDRALANAKGSFVNNEIMDTSNLETLEEEKVSSLSSAITQRKRVPKLNGVTITRVSTNPGNPIAKAKVALKKEVEWTEVRWPDNSSPEVIHETIIDSMHGKDVIWVEANGQQNGSPTPVWSFATQRQSQMISQLRTRDAWLSAGMASVVNTGRGLFGPATLGGKGGIADHNVTQMSIVRWIAGVINK
ncbi:MAG: hypothetical protein HRT35_21915 [Algicola sp.]|nr:hypothetical protein [Algicola sp.]